MSPFEYTELLVSTIAIGLVVLVFGLAAPWYRTWAGRTLFSVKVTLFLVFLVLLLNETDTAERFVEITTWVLFPLGTLASVALLVLMVVTQLSRFPERTAEILFRKNERPHMVWDGTERRHQNLESDGHGKHVEDYDTPTESDGTKSIQE